MSTRHSHACVVLALLLVGTCFRASAGQYAVAYWREAGSYENAGNHSAHVHVWDESGQRLGNKQIYTSWGVLLGTTDANGYTEIVLNRPNGYDFQIRDGAHTSQTTPVFHQERQPNPGQYSFEIGFVYKQSATAPIRFDTNYFGSVNASGTDGCANLSAPHTRSLAYYSTPASNYCGDQYVLGNYVTTHGQTFVATGNRVVGMKAQMAAGGGNHFNWTVQVLDGGPGGAPVGPPRTTRTLTDSEYYSVLVTWGMNDVQVVPGRTYYYRITRGEGINCYRSTYNVYSTGSYFQNDVAMSGIDLMGFVLCATVTNSTPAGTVSGHVRNTSAAPVGGAMVSVAGANLYAISAADGSFSIPFVPAGTHSVTASKSGFITQQAAGISVSVGAVSTIDFELPLQPTNAGSITGVVLDTSGRPVDGARVTAYPANLSAVSDANGQYTMPAVFFGTYRIVASREAFVTAVTNDVSVTNGQSTPLDFSLSPALLQNGNFENEFSNSVATGWRTFTMPGGNSGAYVEESTSKLGGVRAQRWWSSFTTHHSGIFQRIPVVSNALYSFSAWTWRSDSFNNGGINQEMWVGMDPFGGTNPGSANVIWSTPEYSYQTWTRQTAAAVSRSNMLTVFVRGRAAYAGQAMQSVVDDAFLSGPAVFPPGLHAMPGNARVELRWFPSAAGAPCTVKRSTTRGGPYTVIATGITTNSFVDLLVTNEITYEYVVTDGGPDSPPVQATPNGNLTIVAAGSVWRYFDTGANLGTSWQSAAYNDSSWPFGPAQLGFGDGDETTVIASNRQITTYFRRTFQVPVPTLFTNVIVRVLRDDGAVVYLNGTEVFRSNMPGGTIGYLTPALNSVPGGDETVTFYSTNVSPNHLRAGANVLAVEVHQNSNTSSDKSFDLRLEGQLSAAEPSPLVFARTGSMVHLRWSNSAELVLHATTNLQEPILWLPAETAATFSNGQWHAVVATTNAAAFFMLKER